ncbi:hypothetical protein ACIA49_01530 [Kribbella sp. NPDC051587]|uniref:hypothetical protein n=1 Tax=Kribbella sp. NPDC051587 TaxID=3364119 RepID=UPI00378A28D9
MHKRFLATVTLAVAATSLFGTVADAAPVDPSVNDRIAQAALPKVPCDPKGSNSRDGQLANTLNGQLTEELKNAMNAYRVSCARMIVDAVHDRGLTERAAVIAVTTAIVETTLQNFDGGDATSVGLFQQQKWWGTREQRLNATWTTNRFLNEMEKLYPNESWKAGAIGPICQKIQVSAYPDRYGVQAADAQRIVNLLWEDAPVDRTARGPLFNRTKWSGSAGWDASAVAVDGNANITDTAVASIPNSSMYAFNVVKGSGVWYRLRDPKTRKWVAEATQLDTNPNISAIAAAGENDGTLHLFTVVPGAGVFHKIRNASTGVWTSRQVDTNPYTVAVAAAVLPDDTLHLFTAVAGSGVWTREFKNGVWAAAANQVDTNPYITSIGAVGLPDGTLNLFNLVSGSGIWFKSRNVSKQWGGSDPIDLNDSISSLSAAGLPNGSLHVTAVVPGSGLWVRSKAAGATWTNEHVDTNGKIFGSYTAGLNEGTLQVGALVNVN